MIGCCVKGGRGRGGAVCAESRSDEHSHGPAPALDSAGEHTINSLGAGVFLPAPGEAPAGEGGVRGGAPEVRYNVRHDR